MSEFILPPGFAHTTISFRTALVARTMLSTIAFEVDTPPFTQANNDSLYLGLTTALRPLYDADMLFPEIVTLVGGDPPTRFVTTGALVGSRAALNEPSVNVSYLITKATGFSGRRYRGRMYVPSANEAAFDSSGRLSAGELTVLQTAADALEAALVSAPGASNAAGVVLLHSGEPSTPTPVTALQAGSIVATQRRRLVRNT